MDDLDSEENIPTTVIMGDINGLKTVNDTLGHEAGNKLIVTIAEILEKCVGESGIVARWSGDEFAVILPGATMRNGLLLCNRIRSECKSVGGVCGNTQHSAGRRHPHGARAVADGCVCICGKPDV